MRVLCQLHELFVTWNSLLILSILGTDQMMYQLHLKFWLLYMVNSLAWLKSFNAKTHMSCSIGCGTLAGTLTSSFKMEIYYKPSIHTLTLTKISEAA